MNSYNSPGAQSRRAAQQRMTQHAQQQAARSAKQNQQRAARQMNDLMAKTRQDRRALRNASGVLKPTRRHWWSRRDAE
jgi:hypothetical protein